MRKILSLLLACAVVLLLGGCAEKVAIGGTEYSLDSTTLELSGVKLDDPAVLHQFTKLEKLDVRDTGITGEQYDGLRKALPDCEILWTPMFQGTAYDAATDSLTVSALTGEDVDDLAWFTGLTRLDAAACRDYALLAELAERYPNVRVDYVVELGGEAVQPDATEAVFADAAAEELEGALYLLPNLRKLTLTGALPAMEDITRLQAAYPDVELHWEVDICGITVPEDTVELDLSETAVGDVAAVEEKLPYLPKLQKVIMCGCGIPNEEMDALNRRYENIRFVWDVTLGPYITVRTDITEFIVYKYKYKYYMDDEAAYNLRYCTDMVCLDLGHNELTNCDFAAFMPDLKYLVIADTDIADLTPLTGLKNLVYLEAFLCPITDFSPLETLTALEDLNIGYTECEDAAPLMRMTWLKKLWWSRCPLSMEEREPLRAALANTEVVTNQESSTGGGWRYSQNYYDMRDMLGMHYMQG